MRKWFPVVPIVACFAFSAAIYSQLPESIPTHWNAHGEANGYSGRFVGAFMLPAIMLVMWLLLRSLPKIDPRRAHYAKFQETYDLMISVIVTFMGLIHIGVMGRVLGWPIPMHRIVPIAVGGLMLFLGTILPRITSNWWFGIRTPWTLTSETVWAKTHRVGGTLMMIAGAIVLVGVLLPESWMPFLVIIAAGGAGLGAVAYSYFVWREEQKPHGAH